MKILIAGYPYVRENFLDTFKETLETGEVIFLLPDEWKIKGGKYTYKPPRKRGIFTAKALFHHSHYPFIGGLLKGLMPAFPLFLLRHKNDGIRIVFTPTEPVLLSTLYQSIWSWIFGLRHVIFTWENISYEKKFAGLNLLIKKLIFGLNMYFSVGLVCGNQKSAGIHKELTNKPIAVIPLSGVDTEYFRSDNRPAQSGDAVTFLFAGAISRHKGVFTLIDALAEVISHSPSIRLIIAGSGGDDVKLDEYIRRKNLQQVVVRHPWVGHKELRHLMAESDIFVYPSTPSYGWEEQFGYSMAEASAMSLPVITTDTGSINEVIKNGETGLLVEPANIVQLAGGMTELAVNADMRKRLGQAGRSYIEANFSYHSVARNFHEFFAKL